MWGFGRKGDDGTESEGMGEMESKGRGRVMGRRGKEGKVEVQFINVVIQNPHNEQDKLEKSRRANLADP
jgi:hypothetical protein